MPPPPGLPQGSLVARATHFYEESERIVPRVSAILQNRSFDPRSLNELGRLVDQSQQLSVTLLRNTTAETEFLPRAARSLGAVASCGFGAGFGGSCWALVAAEDAEELCQKWRAAYVQRFAHRESASSFFVMAPGPGACSP